MSIYYHSFQLGELYEAVGSNDKTLLGKLEQRLQCLDPELLVAAKAIVADGLLYHATFNHDTYNSALTMIVQMLPSYRNFFEDRDYQTDYHDAWRTLPRRSLVRTYWGYLTHGRYLFDHPIAPMTGIRYGYLTQEELPEFLYLTDKYGESLPWYFFQQTVDAIKMTLDVGDDLYVSINIRGRRLRVARSNDLQNK